MMLEVNTEYQLRGWTRFARTNSVHATSGTKRRKTSPNSLLPSMVTGHSIPRRSDHLSPVRRRYFLSDHRKVNQPRANYLPVKFAHPRHPRRPFGCAL